MRVLSARADREARELAVSERGATLRTWAAVRVTSSAIAVSPMRLRNCAASRPAEESIGRVPSPRACRGQSPGPRTKAGASRSRVRRSTTSAAMNACATSSRSSVCSGPRGGGRAKLAANGSQSASEAAPSRRAVQPPRSSRSDVAARASDLLRSWHAEHDPRHRLRHGRNHLAARDAVSVG